MNYPFSGAFKYEYYILYLWQTHSLAKLPDMLPPTPVTPSSPLSGQWGFFLSLLPFFLPFAGSLLSLQQDFNIAAKAER